jgi:hypothetical protein
MSPVGMHLTTCCGFGPGTPSNGPLWGTLTTHLPPAAVPGPAPLAAPCCTPLQPAVVLGPATLGPYGHFRGGYGVPPKLRTDTEGCGFGQGDRVFTHVLMNALMPSLLKHTLHPDPSQGHNARGAPSVVPSPPALSSLLFVADTSSIVPLLSFIGGFTIQCIKLCRPYRYPLGGCLTSHTTTIIATVLIFGPSALTSYYFVLLFCPTYSRFSFDEPH